MIAEGAQPVHIGNPGRQRSQHLALIRCRIADQQRTSRGIVDVGHRVGGIGRHAFGHAEVIHVTDHHAHLIADLVLAQRKRACGGAGDVVERNPVGRLPLVGELRIAEAINVDDRRRVCGQQLVLHRQPA
ncbi:hypothetical protein D3C76_689570 [compost metagenome]